MYNSSSFLPLLGWSSGSSLARWAPFDLLRGDSVFDFGVSPPDVRCLWNIFFEPELDTRDNSCRDGEWATDMLRGEGIFRGDLLL